MKVFSTYYFYLLRVVWEGNVGECCLLALNSLLVPRGHFTGLLFKYCLHTAIHFLYQELPIQRSCPPVRRLYPLLNQVASTGARPAVGGTATLAMKCSGSQCAAASALLGNLLGMWIPSPTPCLLVIWVPARKFKNHCSSLTRRNLPRYHFLLLGIYVPLYTYRMSSGTDSLSKCLWAALRIEAPPDQWHAGKYFTTDWRAKDSLMCSLPQFSCVNQPPQPMLT